MTKKILIISITLLFIQAGKAYSQCTPDNVNCRDTLLPGEICPAILPDAYVGVAYHQTVTILPPPTATILDVGVTIYKIQVDTVSNLPPGISYETSATDMYPGTAYCVLLSGNPSMTGEFMLSIAVTPYILLLDSIIQVPSMVNDTSVKFTVYEHMGFESTHADRSDDIIIRPNPFSETMQLVCVSDEYYPVKLNVFDYLGNLIYTETADAMPGRIIFRFTGADLNPGCYIFSIAGKQNVYTGKLVKSR